MWWICLWVVLGLVGALAYVAIGLIFVGIVSVCQHVDRFERAMLTMVWPVCALFMLCVFLILLLITVLSRLICIGSRGRWTVEWLLAIGDKIGRRFE